MLSNLWTRVSGALLMIIGLLGAALLYTSGQRDRAKEAASRAKAEAQSKSAVLEVERAIDDARAQVREQSAEKQRDANKRPATDRPTGDFRR